MNGPMAFCPHCKKDTLFAGAGRLRSCTVCGFEYEVTEPPVMEPHWVETAVMTVGHVILRVILIIGVVVLVGVAVVFASCALHL